MCADTGSHCQPAGSRGTRAGRGAGSERGPARRAGGKGEGGDSMSGVSMPSRTGTSPAGCVRKNASHPRNRGAPALYRRPERKVTMTPETVDHLKSVYLVYAAASIGLTIWLARTLFKNGEVFLEEVFADN